MFEVANPDSALPGASWLRDLRNLRRTEYADLGSPPTESEGLDAWQDPDGREQQQYGHLFPPSPDPDVVPAPPTPESQFPQHLVKILSALHLVSMLFDFVTVLDGFPHDQIHIKAHTMSQQIHLACKMNQGLLLGLDSQSELTSQIML